MTIFHEYSISYCDKSGNWHHMVACDARDDIYRTIKELISFKNKIIRDNIDKLKNNNWVRSTFYISKITSGYVRSVYYDPEMIIDDKYNKFLDELVKSQKNYRPPITSMNSASEN